MPDDVSLTRIALGGALAAVGARIGRDLLAPVLEPEDGVVDQELDAGARWAHRRLQEAYR